MKTMTVKLIVHNLFLIVLAFSFGSSSHADEREAKYLVPTIHYLLNGHEMSETPPLPSGAFIERDGLIVVEMESLDAPTGWTLKNDDSEALGSYLEWTDSNSLGTPGNGLISAKVVINNPGIYRFIWRNSIREGTSTTDANDSFLRIIANNFYGFRRSDDSVVCPRDQLASNRCNGRAPEGASSDGWFKIYRSGGPIAAWLWISSTSDSDAHAVYAEFDSAGEYEVQISGRSRSHAIDRFVLFRSLNDDDNVDQSFATDPARPESTRVP